MSSKYDEFWTERLPKVMELCNQAKKRGFSEALSLQEIVPRGNRESWSGLSLVKGNRVLKSSMAHAASLAHILTTSGKLSADPNAYRLVIDGSPALRIYRMNWEARKVSSDGIESSSLSIPQVAVLELIAIPFCAHFAGNSNSQFEVSELATWIKGQFPFVAPFTGDRGMKEYTQRNPGKIPINLQDACYHLSNPGSFWIQVTGTKTRVTPLTRESRMVYSVKSSWKNLVPGVVDVLEMATASIYSRFEVEPPVRHQPEMKSTKGSSGLVGSTPDYAKIAESNRDLGLLGEKFILAIEQQKLRDSGHEALASKVVHVSVEEGDGAGYDIRSFDKDGKQIYIEVKTTAKASGEPFIVTKNELSVSRQFEKCYWLYRVFDFDKESCSGKYFAVQGALDAEFTLEPMSYSARR